MYLPDLLSGLPLKRSHIPNQVRPTSLLPFRSFQASREFWWLFRDVLSLLLQRFKWCWSRYRSLRNAPKTSLIATQKARTPFSLKARSILGELIDEGHRPPIVDSYSMRIRKRSKQQQEENHSIEINFIRKKILHKGNETCTLHALASGTTMCAGKPILLNTIHSSRQNSDDDKGNIYLIDLLYHE